MPSLESAPAPRLPHDPLWPRTGGWPAPEVDAPADFVLVGVPTHATSISATNAHETPAAVRAVLPRYAGHALAADGSNIDIDAELRIADAGDLDSPDFDPELDDVVPAVPGAGSAAASGTDAATTGERAAAARIRELADVHGVLFALGGDNAATVPAALGAWGEDIATAGLITLDAHHDIREGVSNGSPVRRLIEAGLDGRRVVQIGIADFANSLEYTRRAAELGITVIPRSAFDERPLADLVARALEIAGAAGGPVHVDLDVDVCDRAAVPACPASVPGGISANELRRVTRALARDARVTSFDTAEVDATNDAPDGRTVRLVAQLVLEAAAGVAERLI